MLDNIDFSNFWNNHSYYLENYVEKPLTDEMVVMAENKLGYKLPDSYIEFLKIQNGGSPRDKVCVVENTADNEVNIVELTGFFGLGSEKESSIFGEFSNEFWFTEWGYPNIGVIIADTISGGHDLVFLDYRECGKDGEPQVSVISQDLDFEIQVLADNFEEFILGLKNEEDVYKN